MSKLCHLVVEERIKTDCGIGCVILYLKKIVIFPGPDCPCKASRLNDKYIANKLRQGGDQSQRRQGS